MEYGFSIQPHATYCFVIPEKQTNPLPLDNRTKGGRKSTARLFRSLNFFWLFSEIKWTYSKIDKRNHKFRMAFITLTLSSEQKHTDDYIKTHMLRPFLKWAFREGKSPHYIWKAETQDNGNIHFHITMNNWIHYRKIREKWNHIQWKHGYISAEADPNSTDVHSVRNESGYISYMSKYLCKQHEPRKKMKVTQLLPFAKNATLTELQVASIACGGVPFYKRVIDGKNWAASSSLLNCSVTFRTDKDEDSGDVWDDYRKALQPAMMKDNILTWYKHSERITMHTKLPKRISDKFVILKNRFDGRSIGLS